MTQPIYLSIETYIGCKVGNGFCSEVGMQLVATDVNGKRKVIFGDYPHSSPCYKIRCGITHYRSGVSKATNQKMLDAKLALYAYRANMVKVRGYLAR
jgi:hypothetical protein